LFQPAESTSIFRGVGGTVKNRTQCHKSVFNIVFKQKLHQGVEVNLAVFLTLALDQLHGPIISELGKNSLKPHWIGDWVNPRASFIRLVVKKKFLILSGIEPSHLAHRQ
jgi:hypothetical protein